MNTIYEKGVIRRSTQLLQTPFLVYQSPRVKEKEDTNWPLKVLLPLFFLSCTHLVCPGAISQISHTNTTLLHLLFASGETELNSMCSNCVRVGLLASVPSLLIMPALILCTYQSRIISVRKIACTNIFQTPVLTSKSRHLFNQVWTLNLTFFELGLGPYLFLVS